MVFKAHKNLRQGEYNMKILSISNINNQTSTSKAPSFQMKTFRPEDIPGHKHFDLQRKITLKLNRLIESGSTDAGKLRKALRDSLLIINRGDWASKILKEHDFIKRKPTLTKLLRSGNIEKQMDVVNEIFKAKSDRMNTDIYNKYLFNTIIPHIQKTDNTTLGDYILSITVTKDHCASSLLERVSLLNELGHNEDHVIELESYIGEKTGVDAEVKKVCPDYVEMAEKISKEAIAKIKNIMLSKRVLNIKESIDPKTPIILG